jgi:hypothetical protein
MIRASAYRCATVRHGFDALVEQVVRASSGDTSMAMRC